jgi:hypothetical protein
MWQTFDNSLNNKTIGDIDELLNKHNGQVQVSRHQLQVGNLSP